MKVFNLTDVETPQLVQQRLVHQTFAVNGTLLAPGEAVDVPETAASTLAHMVAHLVEVGALAIDEVPPLYLAQKTRMHTSSTAQTPASAFPLPTPSKPKEA